jgi:very-short-patch-repair endonuclease
MRQFAEYKFLRQKPLGGYIVDFYCSKLRLVIEIDGESHAETVEYDVERTKILEALGLTVVRYTNDEVMLNIAGVYEDLIQRIGDLK